MQRLEWSGNEKRIAEVEMCFTYEKNQDKDECCGASGRKMRRVCIYCPNHIRWLQRKEKEKEGQKDGDKSENVH